MSAGGAANFIPRDGFDFLTLIEAFVLATFSIIDLLGMPIPLLLFLEDVISSSSSTKSLHVSNQSKLAVGALFFLRLRVLLTNEFDRDASAHRRPIATGFSVLDAFAAKKDDTSSSNPIECVLLIC